MNKTKKQLIVLLFILPIVLCALISYIAGNTITGGMLVGLAIDIFVTTCIVVATLIEENSD